MNTALRYREEELFKLIGQGDTTAFHQLFQSYYHTIYATALVYTKVAQLAEDVVQVVFMKVWEKRLQLTEVQHPKDWLFITARNEIMNSFRRQAVHGSYVQHIRELFREEEASPEDLLIMRQRDVTLQEGINRLSLKQKEAYLLSREKGFSYEEIALQMGISKNTVREHIAKALQSLRKYFIAHKDELTLIASAIVFIF